jgi:hypothetical protein
MKDDIFTFGSANPELCQCRTCAEARNDIGRLMMFIVCPHCGNKRCPHANDHTNECSGSNEPGQPGSNYA